MSEPASTSSVTPPVSTGQGFSVPADVAQKFPELIALIRRSESMNDEERQYWVNILPIMTPDQVQNLRDILENERKQLKAIDDKYAQQQPPTTVVDIQKTEQEVRRKREERTKAEGRHKQQENRSAEELLKKIEEV